jgi:hypothetical protein
MQIFNQTYLVKYLSSMKLFIKNFFKSLFLFSSQFGFNPKKLISLKNYLRFRKDRKEWIKKGGIITHNYMRLSDYDSKAGNAKGHYFHQDLLVARFIFENQPKRHLDIGSRVDGFVAHVASFRKIEVVDVRPLDNLTCENIKFIKADLMKPNDLGKTESISCLHAIEHFGLGRYTDPIDIEGHNKGITNLVNLVCKDGYLYISFPVGQNDEIHFNAHRVFKVDTILKHSSIIKEMRLIRFDYVDDEGNLHRNTSVENFDKTIKYGCGIYTFRKTND